MSSMTVDALFNWMQSLIGLTERLSTQLESDEIAPIETLLEQRELLLFEQKIWLEWWKDSTNSADNNTAMQAHLKSLVEKLVQADNTLVALVAVKKEKMSEQLKQAQNQKLLLAYSI